MKRTVSHRMFEPICRSSVQRTGGDDPSGRSSSGINCRNSTGKRLCGSISLGIGDALESSRDQSAASPPSPTVTRSSFSSKPLRVVLVDQEDFAPHPQSLRRRAGGPNAQLRSFLKTCFMCKKDILCHGRDIFMYKCRTFCSAQCRHQQIFHDELLEQRDAKCSSEALKQDSQGEAVVTTATAAA